MRGLIFAVAVMLAGVAHADNAVTSIMGVTSTMTVSGISIATQTATSVVISTAPLYRQVCVQNLDWSNFIACGENPSVSTLTASGLMGVYLTTATAASLGNTSPCFEVVPGKNFYCLSASHSAPSPAVIIRKR